MRLSVAAAILAALIVGFSSSSASGAPPSKFGADLGAVIKDCGQLQNIATSIGNIAAGEAKFGAGAASNKNQADNALGPLKAIGGSLQNNSVDLKGILGQIRGDALSDHDQLVSQGSIKLVDVSALTDDISELRDAVATVDHGLTMSASRLFQAFGDRAPNGMPPHEEQTAQTLDGKIGTVETKVNSISSSVEGLGAAISSIAAQASGSQTP